MPAPTTTQIKENIKIALLAAGYHKVAYDKDGNKQENPLELMEEMDKIISAISSGISATWVIWQASQTVASPVQVVPLTGTGATVPTPGSLP